MFLQILLHSKVELMGLRFVIVKPGVKRVTNVLCGSIRWVQCKEEPCEANFHFTGSTRIRKPAALPARAFLPSRPRTMPLEAPCACAPLPDLSRNCRHPSFGLLSAEHGTT